MNGARSWVASHPFGKRIATVSFTFSEIFYLTDCNGRGEMRCGFSHNAASKLNVLKRREHTAQLERSTKSV